MKKILSALAFAICILSVNFGSANYFEDLVETYENNPDYYFVCNVQHSKIYLKLKSVEVQEYNPPHYQISGKFVDIGINFSTDKVEENFYSKTIKYNWYTKDAFEFSNGKWRKMSQGPQSSTPVAFDKKIANSLFIAAYGMKFYD